MRRKPFGVPPYGLVTFLPCGMFMGRLCAGMARPTDDCCGASCLPESILSKALIPPKALMLWGRAPCERLEHLALPHTPMTHHSPKSPPLLL